MSSESIIKLAVAAFMPVVAAAVLYILGKYTPLKKLPYIAKQIICGIIFGAIAVYGTEYGVPITGAQINCRDAAVLTAGLMFGGPAGIIAGIIGGVERWIAVAWGIGSFTRVACSVSTFLAGVYAALLRKFMFEDKKPGWTLSLAIGVVMEVFHITMVFVTNMATPDKAMAVVKACTIPMVLANGISVFFATVVVSLIGHDHLSYKKDSVKISQTVQRWLLITVVLAFAATSFFVFRLQDEMANTQAESTLKVGIQETVDEVREASDNNLISITKNVSSQSNHTSLNSLAATYNLAEISLINKDGIIYKSTVPEYVGFDMSSGEQAKEFLCLLGDTTQYVQEYGPITSDPNISRKYAGIKTSYGFIQVGYDAAQLQSDISNSIMSIAKHRHIGKTGYVLVLDKDKNIVSTPLGMTADTFTGEIAKFDLSKKNKVFDGVLDGVNNVCCVGFTEGYYVLACLPETEALQMRNIALYVNTFMEILVFAVLFLIIYLLIKHVVVNQIKSINSSLAKITGGDLNEIVNVRSNEEFASLSDDINSTVDTLKRYIAEASARIDKELEFAKNIQSSALPNTFPAFPKRKDFDIFASMNPAKEVGGDFYDFYMTHDDDFHFLVADVSGKGIPAAMFMMRAKTELKTLTEADVPLDEVFTHGNAALCEGNDAGMFVTAWQGNIDLKNGVLHYANAGHNPPLVRHENGKFEYLKSRAGFVLAGMDGVSYKSQELTLSKGDIVYLYTDGVTEAQNSQNELYGEERLLNAINSREFDNMEELCKFIKSDVDKFVGEAPQFDDITMVAFKYIGTKPDPTIHFDNAKIEDITTVTEFVEAELEKMDCPMKTVVQINVAIDEIFSNIVNYAYKKKPNGGPITVKVVEKQEPHRVYIRFSDEGIPYNPLTREDPDITLSAEERGIGGLGIYMVKKTMDGMKYKYENDQNVLTIKKLLE